MKDERSQIADLCRRLRQYEGRSFETTTCYNGLRDEAAGIIEALASPSQVAPQPQAGEPVAWQRKSQSKYGPMSDEYTGDTQLAEMWRGHPNTTNVTPLYASPQPANPAQVTDAYYDSVALEAAREIMTLTRSGVFDDRLKAKIQVRISEAIAAIGAGGQAVAEVNSPAWLAAQETLTGTCAWCRGTGSVRTRDLHDEISTERCPRCGGQGVILSALSQPHPADERVVEALREARRGLNMVHDGLMDPTRPRQSVGEVAAYWLEQTDAALAALATEGRKNG